MPILTPEEVATLPGLPAWVDDPRTPAWLIATEYLQLGCMDVLEVQHGLSQEKLRSRLTRRKYNQKLQAQRNAALAAETPEQRSERVRRKKQAQQLSSRQSRVKMYQNRIAEAEARGDFLASMSILSYRVHLAESEVNLARYVEHELRREFASE
jgi:hypothetical protein